MPKPQLKNLLALFDWAMLHGDYDLYLIVFDAIILHHAEEYFRIVEQRKSRIYITYADFIYAREMKMNFRKLEALLDGSFKTQ